MTLKSAIVTGEGSGIGRGIARAMDGLGLRLALIGRDQRKLDETRRELAGGRDSALTISCDVGDRASVKAMVGRVLEEFGSIDVLVCNAGTNVRNRSLEALSPEDWDKMIEVNLTGRSTWCTTSCPRCASVRTDW